MSQDHLSKIKRGDTRGIDVVILTYENGHRIKSHSLLCTLATANGKTLIENQISILQSAFSDSDLFVLTGPESDHVTKYLPHNVRVIENRLYNSTGIAENIRLVINNSVNKRLLIISANVILNKKLLSGLEFSRSFSVCHSYEKIKSHEIGVTIDDDCITQFSFGLNSRWCGVDFIQKDEFDLMSKLCKNRDKNKLFMFEILNFIVDNDGDISPHCPDKMSCVQKINSAKELYENTNIQ